MIHRPQPLVSVIVPTYNGARYIAETLESIFSQTYKNIEIIVVNDGSTDETGKVLNPYKERIQYISQENRGIPAARNRAIRNANGKYIALLDHDDLWLPEKIELQVKLLEENDEYGFVHCNWFFFSETDSKVRTFHKSVPPTGYVFPQLFMRNFIGCLTMLMRMECIEKSGDFDERHAGCDDYDLWLRVARHFKGAYIDKILAGHRRHASNYSHDRVRATESLIYVCKKILQLFPSAVDEIGREAVSRRFLDLWEDLWDLGHEHLDCFELLTARYCFKRALVHSPRSWSDYAYYLSTWLPIPALKALRRIKGRAPR